MIIITITIFILILGILILSHEFGHFIVAKKSGVKVEEFAIGFPPRIFKFKRGETLYSINLIPLGGYIKEDEKSFLNKSVRTRAKIMIAGVGMNFLLSIILLTILSIFIYPWYKGFFMGIVNAFYISGIIIVAFAGLLKDLILSGKINGGIMGPVGIAGVMGQIVSKGFLNILYFTSLLSIDLAIINILPLPALDGGHLVFLAIEKIKGSPVSQKLEKIVHGVGFALLICLMIAVTWRDIAHIIK